MSVYMMCERALKLVGMNNLKELSAPQTAMLESLNYQGLVDAHAAPEAVLCALHFASVRDTLLQQYPWVFARKHLYAASLSDGLPGWRFSYSLPTDCLRPLQFISRGRAVTRYELSGRIIGCDRAKLALRYTSRVSDTDSWVPVFVDAFCVALAAEIASASGGEIGAAAARVQSIILEAYRVGIIDEVPGVTLDIDNGWDTYTHNMKPWLLGLDCQMGEFPCDC